MWKLFCAVFGCPRPDAALLNDGDDDGDEFGEMRFAVEKRCRRCRVRYSDEEVGWVVMLARTEEYIRRRRARIAKDAVDL